MTAPALVAAVHPSRKTVASTAALLLVAAVIWTTRDYRLPLPAKSQALNRAKSWSHLMRLDTKGVPQVWVPPGCFEMGSNPLNDLRARADETPRYTVCITSGFWLDRYEVTNESFRQFVGEGGYQQRQYWSEEGWRMHEGRRTPYPLLRDFDKPRQPRVKLTWYEAEAYAAWRGGRLPTEAQWEWAADGYDPNAYRHSQADDPFTTPTGILRVIRGGAWGGVPGGSVSDLRCARRAAWPADNRKLSHGARIMHPAS